MLALHVRRPFGEHVRAWVGLQQSTLVRQTRGVDNDDDDDLIMMMMI